MLLSVTTVYLPALMYFMSVCQITDVSCKSQPSKQEGRNLGCRMKKSSWRFWWGFSIFTYKSLHMYYWFVWTDRWIHIFMLLYEENYHMVLSHCVTWNGILPWVIITWRFIFLVSHYWNAYIHWSFCGIIFRCMLHSMSLFLAQQLMHVITFCLLQWNIFYVF